MLATTIRLLFIAKSFAKDWVPYAHQQVLNEDVDSGTPMDYLDGINLPNPHYKINYIYEQIKTDEDPEIEEINEEIGKYMHYQPSTTTATEPQQNIDDINENFKVFRCPFETPIIVLETHHNNYEKKEVSSTLTPMPPAPKLQELRESIHPHFPTPLPATVLYPLIAEWEPMKDVPNNDVETQTNHAFTEKHIHLSPTTQNPLIKSRNGNDALAKIRPILDYNKHGSIELATRPVYRGSYKFSWIDINDTHIFTVPKVSQLKENPIPSVPTLSPWYDGYGK